LHACRWQKRRHAVVERRSCARVGTQSPPGTHCSTSGSA
jgi:hypothetical protein